MRKYRKSEYNPLKEFDETMMNDSYDYIKFSNFHFFKFLNIMTTLTSLRGAHIQFGAHSAKVIF